MIAKHSTLEEAIAYSEEIHNWLKANRSGYTANLWMIPIESEDGKFCIKIPKDFEKYKAKLNLKGTLMNDAKLIRKTKA